MQRDWIDILLGTLMLGGLFTLVKFIGYGFESIVKRNNTTKTIAGIECTILKEDGFDLCIGGKQLIQSQMEAIIAEANVPAIVFYRGSNTVTGQRYAIYNSGKLKFLESGRVVTLDNKDE